MGYIPYTEREVIYGTHEPIIERNRRNTIQKISFYYCTIRQCKQRSGRTLFQLSNRCWIVRRGDKQIQIKKGLPQSLIGYDVTQL